MNRLTFLGLAASASAALQFGYDLSATRTFLTDDAVRSTFDCSSVR